MKRIRIGNDILIKWTIMREGQPEDLSGKELKLIMHSPGRSKEVEDYQIDGNVISWIFYGKDQKFADIYSFTLIENDGEKGMFTVDACDALMLVKCSHLADSADSDMAVDTETDSGSTDAEMTSDIEIPATMDESEFMDKYGPFLIAESDLNGISEENFAKLDAAIREHRQIFVVVEDSENYDTWRTVTAVSAGRNQIIMYWMNNRTLYIFNGGPGRSPKESAEFADVVEVNQKIAAIRTPYVWKYYDLSQSALNRATFIQNAKLGDIVTDVDVAYFNGDTNRNFTFDMVLDSSNPYNTDSLAKYSAFIYDAGTYIDPIAVSLTVTNDSITAIAVAMSRELATRAEIDKKQNAEDNDLQTEDKTMTGAINEIVASIGDISTILDEINS